MQSEGVLGSAKHFPGHGDTATDSHLNLPVITADKARLEREELVPFKALIESNIASVMIAHIALESITGDSTIPASLSYKVSTELLKEQMGYQGLVITDALNMKGVSKFVNVNQVALEAFLAGADILLYPENIEASIEVLKAAYNNKRFSEERLAFSVKKILKAKYMVGLNRFEPIEDENLESALNATADQLLSEELYEAAITTVLNTEKTLPLKLDRSYLFVSLGEQADRSGTFFETMQR
jgi:beta-glucosidase-like glycosyl hydrolase